MEKHDLEDQLRNCPLRLRMSDGRAYVVEKPEFITVGDYTASVLLHREGAMRHSLLDLLSITAVEPLGEAVDN